MNTTPAILSAALLVSLVCASPSRAQPAVQVGQALTGQLGEWTHVSFSDAESWLGLAVHLSGGVRSPVAGHRYGVYYQLRVHERRGEAGVLLGATADSPGKAFPLGDAQPDPQGGGLRFDFTFDVTRKELCGSTNLRQGQMFVRLEPQIYDATDQKWITPSRSPALVLVLEVGTRAQVWRVQPFGNWFAAHCGPTETKAALAALASLDAIDQEGNAIVPAFEAVFGNANVAPAELVQFVEALPAEELAFGKNNLRVVLGGMAQHPSEVVRATVQKKQTEAEALRATREAGHKR